MKKKRNSIHILVKNSVDTIKKIGKCKYCGIVPVIIVKRPFRNKPYIGWRCKNSAILNNIVTVNIKNIPINILYNGICSICNIDSKLVIDHCHTTNEFRGFICHACNKMLGFSKDNVSTLSNGIKYLQNK